MNIEIANRLLELRRQHNLSQEDLAEKIQVSRQAVSKWERAESAPDTNNLLELAKLYGITLDQLLYGTTDTDESEENEKADDKPKESVSIGLDGIHIVDGDDEVYVGPKGVHIKEDGETAVNIGFAGEGVHINGKKVYSLGGAFSMLVGAAYLALGFIVNLWHPGWLIFFAIPIYYQIAAMFHVEGVRAKLNTFPISVMCTAAFLFLGICHNLWHPMWAILLIIPFYHTFVSICFKK